MLIDLFDVLRNFSFFDSEGRALFYVRPIGDIPPSYLNHIEKMHPHIKGRGSQVNPVVNFMLLQKDKMEALFSLVESHHKKPFWKVFLDEAERVGHNQIPHHIGASEFTLYYFFCAKFYADQIKTVPISMVPFGDSFDSIAEAIENQVDVFSYPHFRRKSV